MGVKRLGMKFCIELRLRGEGVRVHPTIRGHEKMVSGSNIVKTPQNGYQTTRNDILHQTKVTGGGVPVHPTIRGARKLVFGSNCCENPPKMDLKRLGMKK